jgi:hypothetical protein
MVSPLHHFISPRRNKTEEPNILSYLCGIKHFLNLLQSLTLGSLFLRFFLYQTSWLLNLNLRENSLNHQLVNTHLGKQSYPSMQIV